MKKAVSTRREKKEKWRRRQGKGWRENFPGQDRNEGLIVKKSIALPFHGDRGKL
jgi:hypothetical protein